MNQTGAIAVSVTLIILVLSFIFYQHPPLVTLPWALFKHALVFIIDEFNTLFGIESKSISYVNAYLKQTPYTDITYETMFKVEKALYAFGGWIPPLIMVGLGAHTFIKNRPKYRQSHTFETLLEQESQYWRFNRYLVKINPFDDSNDMTKGKFRMPDKPIEFLERHKLLNKVDDAPSKIIRNKAKKVFVPTLGKVIAGLESFSENEKIVLGILLAVIYPERGNNGKPGKPVKFNHIDKLGRDYAIRGLIGDISYSISGELPASKYKKQVKEILSKCWDCPYIAEKLKRHAYTSTFIRGIFIDVKRGGVFPPAYLTWMKLWDRNLFYNLHSTGVPGTNYDYVKKENQPGKNIEIAMIARHYTSERISKSAIPVAEIDLLCDDIDSYLERKFEMENGL